MFYKKKKSIKKTAYSLSYVFYKFSIVKRIFLLLEIYKWVFKELLYFKRIQGNQIFIDK